MIFTWLVSLRIGEMKCENGTIYAENVILRKKEPHGWVIIIKQTD